MKVYCTPNLKKLSRKHRNNNTLSDILLWKQIKGRISCKGSRLFVDRRILHGQE
jgi:hypothetical protein